MRYLISIIIFFILSPNIFPQGNQRKIREQDLVQPLKAKLANYDSLTSVGDTIFVWKGGTKRAVLSPDGVTLDYASASTAKVRDLSIVLRVADTTALKALSVDSLGMFVFVADVGNGSVDPGFYRLASSGTPDGINTFSAPGGRYWRRINAIQPDMRSVFNASQIVWNKSVNRNYVELSTAGADTTYFSIPTWFTRSKSTVIIDSIRIDINSDGTTTIDSMRAFSNFFGTEINIAQRTQFTPSSGLGTATLNCNGAQSAYPIQLEVIYNVATSIKIFAVRIYYRVF